MSSQPERKPKPNATAAALLGLLHNGPQSGWDLVGAADAVLGPFWSVTRSQVYRELGALADAELVRADDVGPRDRRPFRITRTGRTAFRRWIGQQPPQEQIRFPLLLTLAFAQHLSNEQLRVIITQHRAAHEARLIAYSAGMAAARESGAPAADLVTADFGIRYETAVLDWFDHLPDPFHAES